MGGWLVRVWPAYMHTLPVTSETTSDRASFMSLRSPRHEVCDEAVSYIRGGGRLLTCSMAFIGSRAASQPLLPPCSTLPWCLSCAPTLPGQLRAFVRVRVQYRKARAEGVEAVVAAPSETLDAVWHCRMWRALVGPWDTVTTVAMRAPSRLGLLVTSVSYQIFNHPYPFSGMFSLPGSLSPLRA